LLRRLIATLFASLALTAAAVAAVACGGGGGDTLTLEEYFAALQALDDQFEADSDALNSSLEGLSDDEIVEQAPDVFAQQADNVKTFIDGLDDLNAPDEAKDLQEEAVSAGRDAHASLVSLTERMRDAETTEELNAAFDDPEADAVFARFDQVCLDEEALAAEHDITIDLNCEE
jgi:hypothetical protein